MLRSVGLKFLCGTFSVVLASFPARATQDTRPVAPAPLSSPSGALPKVFISNTGDGEHVVLDVVPSRVFNRFYAAMQTSGRYELVTLPGRADLIFEVNYSEPWELVPPLALAKDTPCDPHPDRRAYHPQIRLNIWDTKARVFLAGFTAPFASSSSGIPDFLELQLNGKIDGAIAELVNRAEHLFNRPPISISRPRKVGEAPVPPQIAGATKVFISDADRDRLSTIEGADQLYNNIVSGMKNWGRFELVSGSENADLIFELSLHETARTVVETEQWSSEEKERNRQLPCTYKTTVTNVLDRQIELKVVVPQTHDVLWGFFQPIEGAFKAATPKGRLDHATKTLFSHLRHVVEASAAAVAHTASATSTSAKP